MGPSVGFAVCLLCRFLSYKTAVLCCAYVGVFILPVRGQPLALSSLPCPRLISSLDSSSYSFKLQLFAQPLLWPGPTQVLEEIQYKLRSKGLPVCKGGTHCPTDNDPNAWYMLWWSQQQAVGDVGHEGQPGTAFPQGNMAEASEK